MRLAMSRDKHFNPLLEKRLLTFFVEDGERGMCCDDVSGLVTCLGTLSNADFRTAGFLLGERILPRCSADGFWTVALRLTEFNSKAFLVTLLKSLSLRDERVNLQHPALKQFVRFLNEKGNGIDKQKFILWVLPLLNVPADVEMLFEMLEITSPSLVSDFLIHQGSTLSYYALFQLLRRQEGDMTFAEECCRRLMRRGDGLSFNVASVFKVYFGLENIRGTFSLNLAPYEMSRLERSYDAFVKIVS
jgi:hypothetical protein